MRKYLLRYLIFWAPAFLAACFFNNASMPSQILQWFFAFFMIFGGAVNTAMAANRYPKEAISDLLIWLGVNLFAITMLYEYNNNPATRTLFLRLGGATSFTPLDIVVTALLDFDIPHEMFITVFLFCTCFVGFLAGLIYRRSHPSPYSPKLSK
jgi:hypothetical protein